MPIAFDRAICCDLTETISREWLITNGQGGFAAGTVAGVLTRMHHGLLVAPPPDTVTPHLMLAKIDEEVVFDQRTYYLGTNEYQDGTLNPTGFVHLESFLLEQGFPIFTYRLGGIDGILLEKRIWMPHGLNTTYIQYRVLRNTTIKEPALSMTNGSVRFQDYPEAVQRKLTFKLLPFSAYRPFQEPQYGNMDWNFQVEMHSAEHGSVEGEQGQNFFPKGMAGCTIRAWDGAHPYHILVVGHPESQTTFIPTGVWYWHFLRRHDRTAGLPAIDDLYLPGVIRTTLWPGEDAVLTIIVTAEPLESQSFSLGHINLSYQRSLARQRSLGQTQRYFGEGGETVLPPRVLPPTASSHPSTIPGEEYLRLLLLAGDRFFSRRTSLQSDVSGAHSLLFNEKKSIPLLISSFFDLEESTRDSLIALPGLTLATGLTNEASSILRYFARFFRQGLLPDQVPRGGRSLTEQDYGSVDTTLWYFYALEHYLQVTRDYELLDDLYTRLFDSISWYFKGTYNNIHGDPSDWLLHAEQPEKALTWMNTLVNAVPVTPRHGKPVEVNALWYHALSLMEQWSRILHRMGRISDNSGYFLELSERCKQSFNKRFWNPVGGFLYDVIDGPNGNDTTLRPNQLLALSLSHPVLEREYFQSVFDQVTKHLVTPYGLRTLSSNEAEYRGRFNGNLEEQQLALHQGSAWPWLFGPYIDAMLRIEEISYSSVARSSREQMLRQEYVWRKGVQLLDFFRNELETGVLGMIGMAFEGDPPHTSNLVGHKVVSALSVGEILRVYNGLANKNMSRAVRAIPV